MLTRTVSLASREKCWEEPEWYWYYGLILLIAFSSMLQERGDSKEKLARLQTVMKRNREHSQNWELPGLKKPTAFGI